MKTKRLCVKMVKQPDKQKKMMMIIFFNFILFFIRENFTFEDLIVEWMTKKRRIFFLKAFVNLKNIQNLPKKWKSILKIQLNLNHLFHFCLYSSSSSFRFSVASFVLQSNSSMNRVNCHQNWFLRSKLEINFVAANYSFIKNSVERFK